MAKKIIIASGKGGVGKSTSACAIGKLLSEAEKRTLIVDCDAGMNSVNIMLRCAEQCVFNWYDVYSEQCGAESAPVKLSENLSVLSAPTAALEEDAADAIQAVVSQLENSYDFILLDAPAGLGRGLTRAANAAKTALVVATGDRVCVQAAATVATMLRSKGIDELRLLLNRYDLRAAKRGKYLTIDEMIDLCGVQLLGIIPEDKQIMYSTVTGEPKKPSRSTRAFTRISRRICGENVPLRLSLLR